MTEGNNVTGLVTRAERDFLKLMAALGRRSPEQLAEIRQAWTAGGVEAAIQWLGRSGPAFGNANDNRAIGRLI